MSFIREFKRVQKMMYKINAQHGFHDKDHKDEYDYMEPLFKDERVARISQRLMLAVGELSEAQEAMRHDNPPDAHIPKFSGLEAELADAVIRIMDIAETTRCRLAEAIIAKASYNNLRPKMHGKKF